MNQYEGMFIINMSLAPDAQKKAVSDVQEILKREGAEIVGVEEWGRRRLAYMVKKQHEGYYLLVNFDMDPAKVERVRKLFVLNDGVLRFILLKRVPKNDVPPRNPETQEHEAPAAV